MTESNSNQLSTSTGNRKRQIQTFSNSDYVEDLNKELRCVQQAIDSVTKCISVCYELNNDDAYVEVLDNLIDVLKEKQQSLLEDLSFQTENFG